MTNIQKLTSTDAADFAALLRIFQLVFEHENTKVLDNQHLADLLAKENFWVLVAKKENMVASSSFYLSDVKNRHTTDYQQV